jgi:hypothetical protein
MSRVEGGVVSWKGPLARGELGFGFASGSPGGVSRG